MTSVFTVRRRAEEFSSLVGDTSTGQPTDPRFADLVELVDQLRALEPPAPRPEFTASLRAELMAAADGMLVPSTDTQRLTLPPRRTARDRRVAAAVGGLAIVGATTSLAVAAQSALPGEMLYPLKRAIESVETHAQPSDQAKAASLLADATTRLEEAAELARGGDLGDVPGIAASFTDFAEQAKDGSRLVLDDYARSGDPTTIERLNRFTTSSMDTLTRLESVVPDDAREELIRAARVLEEIDAAASRACPSCSGGIDQLPQMLLTAGDRAASTTTVVVPGTLVPDRDPLRTGDRNEDRSGTRGRSGGHEGSTLTGPLSGDVSTTPETGGDASPTDDGQDTLTDTIDDVTDGITGGSGGAGGGGATTGSGGLDDTVDDVGDTLDDTVDGVTDGLGDVGGSVAGLP